MIYLQIFDVIKIYFNNLIIDIYIYSYVFIINHKFMIDLFMY